MRNKKTTAKYLFFLQNKIYFNLFRKIPYGSATQIRKRLVDKFGESHNFSLNYINMVINPDNSRMNMDIMKEAVEYFNEVLLTNAKLIDMMKKLNKNDKKNRS